MTDIRQFIKLLLSEAAVTSADNLALCVIDRGRAVKLTLYSPEFLASNIARAQQNAKQAGKRQLAANIISNAVEKLDDMDAVFGRIVAARHSGECNGAIEIINSAARKGYGPFMYDITGHFSEGNVIMADRNNVSPSAQKVWTFYKGNRGDVKALPLDNAKAPKTPPPEDDCKFHGDNSDDPLNSAFKVSPPDISSLVAKHEQFCKLASATFTKLGASLTSEEVSERIDIGGSMFFTKMYHGD
jgi:hypothetical protein